MTWVLLALVAAALTAAREVIFKVAMRGGDATVIACVVSAVVALLLLPPALLVGVPPLSAPFFLATLGSAALNAVALVFVVRAVHRSDLSLVSPLQSLTPLFMLAWAPLLLAESPTAQGMAGVTAIVAGAYLLNAGEAARGWLEPFRALGRDAGARLMLLVAFAYSISASLDKVGTLAATPLLYGAALNAVVALALLPRALRIVRGLGGAVVALGRPRLVLLGGALTALALAAQFTALTLTVAAYVIAVKRTSILVSVAAGHLVFGEAGLRQRLLATAVMLLGFALVSLS